MTAREREVMALVAEGLSNEEVAGRLVISAATAKTHVSHAMTKVRARDRAHLVVLAYQTGLVRPIGGYIQRRSHAGSYRLLSESSSHVPPDAKHRAVS